MNKVILVGNVGQEGELRFTTGGQAVLNLRVATGERFKGKDEQWQERTEWHSVVIFGKRAEGLAKIIEKGTAVAIDGSLRTTSFDGRDGQKRYKTEIVAHDVELVGKGRGQGGASAEQREQREERAPAREAGDDYGDGSIPW